MRADNTLFATDNVDAAKQPRYVVSIDFDGTLQHITSHDDIANVPSALPILQNALIGISATSQTLNPDRANATIGSMSFDVLDLASAFTNVVRTRLTVNNTGLRGRTVKFYVGYKSEQDGAGILTVTSTDDNPDFDNFVLFQTQIIQSVETKEGRYSIKCADIQRQTKKQIFDLALTYLTASITDVTTTIPVLDLFGFEGNFHGTSYTDAPSQDVIYIRIDQTKEIIRCPVADIVGNSFTNVTRGVLGSIKKAVDVDPASLSDRRPKVEEYVYLELPAVKAAYAILTGIIEGTANVLPSSWHANVPAAFVRLLDFKTIGDDLWVPTDDTAAIVLRFDGIEKQDAKKFLETEIYLLLGLFSPVYADGQLGLKRMVPSLSDSPYQFDIDDSNVTGSSNLVHDMESMQNNLRVDWNWNGDRFLRSTIIVDSASIAKHGQATEKRMGFRGLAGTRFTEQVLRQLLTSLRDMYTGPPLRLDINGFHLMNPLEVGDACRVNKSNIRDYSQAGTNLVRTMVIHGMSVDWLKGVKLKLFGSSERADEIPPITATTCLPDAFYPQAGTALNSIPGLMTGNVTNAGTFTLVGDVDMNAAGAIFYHDAPLTISSTTTLNIEKNVQLRVKGFLTIDGSIIGTGQGHPAGTSSFLLNEHYYFTDNQNVGVPGFIGNSMSHHGLLFREPDDGGIPKWVWVTGPYFTQGLFDAFPNLVLEVDDAGSGSIIGIPTDMRGGGGAFGARSGLKIGISGRSHMKNAGGAGGAGGAALAVVCRGGDFGVSGVIRLDGADAVEPTGFFITAAGPVFHIYGGAGGAGCPGALLWLIDGSAQTFPDIAGHFFALTGNVPAQFALPFQTIGQNRSLSETNAPQKNMAPFMPGRISGFDQTGVNFRISFLPCDVVPTDDQAIQVVAPTGLTATATVDGVVLAWTNPGQEIFDHIEIHASDEDVRATAIVIGSSSSETFTENIIGAYRNRYYWIRAVSIDGLVSDFEPNTPTTPAVAAPLIASDAFVKDPDFDLSDALGQAASLDFFWHKFVQVDDSGLGTIATDVLFVSGTGRNSSNVMKIVHGDEPNATPPPFVRKRAQLISSRRFRTNVADFTIKLFWRNNGTTVLHDLTIGVRGFSASTGGAALTGGFFSQDYAVTGITWQELTMHVNPAPVDGAQFWEMVVLLDDTDDIPASEVEIDSLFPYASDAEFGTAVAGKVQPGLVPESDVATQSSKFLRGDATWADGLGDVTGAANDDLLYRSAGDWIGTAGLLTWDGSKQTVTGHLFLSGNNSFITPANRGLSYHSDANGIIILGEGTLTDLVLANKLGQVIGQIPTGSLNIIFSRSVIAQALFLKVQGGAALDVVGEGQFWVRTDKTPMYTPDDGTDQNIDPSQSEVNVQNGNYTLVLADKGKTIQKESGGAGETFTIPANSAVSYKIGTLIRFGNDGGGVLTIAITTDELEGTDGATGSRTLGDNQEAMIRKMKATKWRYVASDL